MIGVAGRSGRRARNQSCRDHRRPASACGARLRRCTTTEGGGRCPLHYAHGASLFTSCFSFSVGCAGASSTRMKASCCDSSSQNRRWSRSTSIARVRAVSIMNSLRVLPLAAAAASIRSRVDIVTLRLIVALSPLAFLPVLGSARPCREYAASIQSRAEAGRRAAPVLRTQQPLGDRTGRKSIVWRRSLLLACPNDRPLLTLTRCPDGAFDFARKRSYSRRERRLGGSLSWSSS